MSLRRSPCSPSLPILIAPCTPLCLSDHILSMLRQCAPPYSERLGANCVHERLHRLVNRLGKSFVHSLLSSGVWFWFTPTNPPQAITPLEDLPSSRPSLNHKRITLTPTSLLQLVSQEDLRPAAGRHSGRRIRDRAVPQRRTGRVSSGCRGRFRPVWFRDRRGSCSGGPAPGLGCRPGTVCARGIFGSCGGMCWSCCGRGGGGGSGSGGGGSGGGACSGGGNSGGGGGSKGAVGGGCSGTRWTGLAAQGSDESAA